MTSELLIGADAVCDPFWRNPCFDNEPRGSQPGQNWYLKSMASAIQPLHKALVGNWENLLRRAMQRRLETTTATTARVNQMAVVNRLKSLTSFRSIEISLAAKAFCVTHNICAYLASAAEHAQQNFRISGKLVANLEVDGDSGERWVSLLAVVNGARSDVIAARKQYTRWWVTNIPWPERQLIRLSLDMA